MTNPDDKLRAMLREDIESPEEAEALLATVKQIRGWQAPEASAKASAELLKLLAAEMPAPRKSRLKRLLECWPLLVIYSQARVVRSEIWLASALVMVLGTVVTLTTNSASGGTIPLAILAPLVTAVGVAMLYDSDNEPMLELEDATPVSIRLLLLARLTLVFGFDLALGLAGSTALALLNTEISLWPLVMSWLAPMAFLSGLAFLLSVVFIDSLAGALFSLGLWGLHVIMRSTEPVNTLILALSLPGLAAPETRPVLFGLAALLTGLALWLLGRTERHVGEIA
jgi:hypothetical protein